eukprot:10201021-Lingulodinium_polyedra.AAC.1
MFSRSVHRRRRRPYGPRVVRARLWAAARVGPADLQPWFARPARARGGVCFRNIVARVGRASERVCASGSSA